MAQNCSENQTRSSDKQKWNGMEMEMEMEW